MAHFEPEPDAGAVFVRIMVVHVGAFGSLLLGYLNA